MSPKSLFETSSAHPIEVARAATRITTSEDSSNITGTEAIIDGGVRD